jgi:pimeloyl-ACP methyl ester carboxylesterase
MRVQRKILSIVGLFVFAAATLLAASASARTRPVEHTFDSNGVEISYTDEGTGVPVVLVHGFAVNKSLNWRIRGTTEALAKDYRVIALDLRGHGKSGKPHDSSAYGVEMALDVIRLLDHLGIEKAHVVGYSLGGFIALKLAVIRPERLITIAPCGSGWDPPDNESFFTTMDQFADDLESGKGVNPLAGALGGDRQEPTEAHKKWVNMVTSKLNDKDALAAMIRGLRGLSITKEELMGIDLPVCSIVGSDDVLKASMENMVGLVKNQEVTVIEGADHLQATASPELLETLQAFLQKNAPATN